MLNTHCGYEKSKGITNLESESVEGYRRNKIANREGMGEELYWMYSIIIEDEFGMMW